MTHGFLFVLDCPWNRVHSPELIGKRIDPLHPPYYTAVKYERELMDELTNDELACFWNICQFGKSVIQAGDVDTQRRLETITDELLTERFIPHESGKRIQMAA